MAFEIFMLILGLILLIKASDLTIRHAIALSHKTKISQMAIGFIFIAVVTSLPELAIAVSSSIMNEGLLSFGNLIGANVVNLTLIFGLMSLFGMKLTSKEADKSITVLIAATIVGIFLIVL